MAVWDADGRLLGLVVGDELGARRTGALGAVAVDALARPEADIVGVIGTDRQAWTQLWALTAVRDLTQVRVHSPNEQRRRTFAVRAHDELGLVVTPTVDAASAIRNAGIVVLARTSHRTLPGEISRGASPQRTGTPWSGEFSFTVTTSGGITSPSAVACRPLRPSEALACLRFRSRGALALLVLGVALWARRRAHGWEGAPELYRGEVRPGANLEAGGVSADNRGCPMAREVRREQRCSGTCRRVEHCST